jgi:hypothetical protein
MNRVPPMSTEEFNQEGQFKNIKGVYPLAKNKMEKYKEYKRLEEIAKDEDHKENGVTLEERKRIMKARNQKVDESP